MKQFNKFYSNLSLQIQQVTWRRRVTLERCNALRQHQDCNDTRKTRRKQINIHSNSKKKKKKKNQQQQQLVHNLQSSFLCCWEYSKKKKKLFDHHHEKKPIRLDVRTIRKVARCSQWQRVQLFKFCIDGRRNRLQFLDDFAASFDVPTYIIFRIVITTKTAENSETNDSSPAHNRHWHVCFR